MRLCLKQGGMRLHARAAALAQPSGQHVHAGGWHAEWAIALPTRTAGAQHTGLVRCCPTPNTENSSLSAAPHWSSPRALSRRPPLSACLQSWLASWRVTCTARKTT